MLLLPVAVPEPSIVKRVTQVVSGVSPATTTKQAVRIGSFSQMENVGISHPITTERKN